MSIAYNDPYSNIQILLKDVIVVPNRGYVIVRTFLDNPGTWIMHCHIDFHLSLGMALGKIMKKKCLNLQI